MPNAAARRSRKTTPTVSNPEPNGVNVVSTLTVDKFQVEELGDYEFTRAGAGRKREPSPFDDLVQEWAGGPTRRIAVESETEGKEVIKALDKACQYRNRGFEKRLETENDQLYVVFRINPEKATRAPRKPRGENASAPAVTDEERIEAAETE